MELRMTSVDGVGAAARAFVQGMGTARVFAFYGAMGVGKTTFIAAVCHELGVEDIVTSPSFAIANVYGCGESLMYHLDLYRLKNVSEFLDLGGEDYLYSNCLCFVEWPELIEGLLPENTVRVTIDEQADGSRLLRF